MTTNGRAPACHLSAGWNLIQLPGVPAGAAPAGGSGWAALHRPLHLPVLAAGAPCPVSGVDRRIDCPRAHIFDRTAIGPGPVYAGLGFQDGRLHATPDTQYGGRWFGEKVFWYVLLRYRGPVVIRGRRLDGPNALASTVPGRQTPN